MAGRGELTEEAWSAIAPPPPSSGGRHGGQWPGIQWGIDPFQVDPPLANSITLITEPIDARPDTSLPR
jgi:hypothetical protein